LPAAAMNRSSKRNQRQSASWFLPKRWACDGKISGLWIRIDLIRIRIQHFCSIWIRIRAKTELSKTISFLNFFEIKIWVKSNQKYRCYS
jgi:hypothetical protein